KQILRAGVNYTNLSAEALDNLRLPSGHPEGFLEAFANIYRGFAQDLATRLERSSQSGKALLKDQDDHKKNWDYPKVSDGVRGMNFIEAVIRSSKNSGKWTSLENSL